MAPHSSTLAWRIPWTEEPGRLQSMGFRRVGHNWATSLSCIGEGNGNPLQYSCLENPVDGGAWRATAHEVAELDTTEWLHFSFWLTLWLHRVLSLVTIMNRGAFSRGSTSSWCWCNWFCGGLVTESVSHNEQTCLWGHLSSQSSRTVLKHWCF